ncbi:unnamed protein product [Polarella glacialis]|uniref:Uncharacterized protein n=1 Tax=Polarella glacialis TaxID=89957 RepID=A0A813FHD6_POLGL|nr:unnamed protein product [Polarella glacialis]
MPGEEKPVSRGGSKEALQLDSSFRRQFSDLDSECNSPISPEYKKPCQTIIFFDWDDTLFPTEELIDRWGLSVGERAELTDPPLTAEQAQLLSEWQDALCAYLEEACTLSGRCVILTNSKRPWVEDSVARFVPQLSSFFRIKARTDSLKIVYGQELLEMQINELQPRRHNKNHEATPDELQERLTLAKFIAMRKEVTDFYSKYPRQTWKNILSLGDMPYEKDAIQEVAHRRVAPRGRPETLRTKAIVVPRAPFMGEIAHRLRLGRVLLAAYVQYDGDIDLDLQRSPDPMACLGRALNIDALARLPMSRHAWGSELTLDQDSIDREIKILRNAVYQTD